MPVPLFCSGGTENCLTGFDLVLFTTCLQTGHPWLPVKMIFSPSTEVGTHVLSLSHTPASRCFLSSLCQREGRRPWWALWSGSLRDLQPRKSIPPSLSPLPFIFSFNYQSENQRLDRRSSSSCFFLADPRLCHMANTATWASSSCYCPGETKIFVIFPM